MHQRKSSGTFRFPTSAHMETTKERRNIPRLALTMTWRLLRSRVGTVFFLVIATALILYIMNSFANGGRHTSLRVEDDHFPQYGDSGRVGVAAGGMGQGNQRLADWLDEEDEEEQMCEPPNLKTAVDTLKGYYTPYKRKRCRSSVTPLWYQSQGTLQLNETALNGRRLSKCVYKPFTWNTDFSVEVMSDVVRISDPFSVKVEQDFYKVECFAYGHPSRNLLAGDDQEVLESPGLQIGGGLPDPKARGAAVRKEQDPPSDPQNEPKSDLKNRPEDFLSDQHKQEMGQSKRMLEQHEAKKQEELKEGERLSKMKKDVDYEALNVPQEEEQPLDAEENEEEEATGVPVAGTSWQQRLEPEGGAKPDWEQLVAQIHPTKETIRRLKQQAVFPDSLQADVLIMCIGSMSQLDMQRNMPHTHTMWTKSLGGTVMEGYTAMSDHGAMALLPILTGKPFSELRETRRDFEGSGQLDQIAWIWNQYERSGYVTMLAEDRPDLSPFQVALNGWHNQPTDHYMRPFWLAAGETSAGNIHSDPCLHNTHKFQYVLNYVKQFWLRYKKTPKFGVSILRGITSQGPQGAAEADEAVVKLIEELKMGGTLDRTILVLVSDTGLRHGPARMQPQGQVEGRLPFLSLAFPQWFQDNYPSQYSTLQRNARHLVTPLDLHATLEWLLHWERTSIESPNLNRRDLSLFVGHPSNRTCASAGVPHSMCTCVSSFPTQERQGTEVEEAAKTALVAINDLPSSLERQCEVQNLAKLPHCSLILTPEEMLALQDRGWDATRLKNTTSFSQLPSDVLTYRMILTTDKKRTYEATVQVNRKTKKSSLIGEVSSLDPKPSDGLCVQNQATYLMHLCACTNTNKYEL